ncbi:MAG: enoyl-CoA hydratase-related protein [Elusimicrobiota bacterium]
MAFETLTIETAEKTAVVRLNRPKVHNAFNAEMIGELRRLFSELAADEGVRRVILTGEGKSFCAGADLKWLGSGRDAPYERHVAETMELSRMFRAIYDLDKPVIAAVNGAALGGGMGFLGVSDIVIASEAAVFGLSEVKIGVVPACISPYLFLRCGGRPRLREYFMSGERFSPKEAKRAGLVDYVARPEALMEEARAKAAALGGAAPRAQGVCKRLFREVPGMTLDQAMRHTAEVLAEIRTGEEARRGIEAFFGKKEIKWG